MIKGIKESWLEIDGGSVFLRRWAGSEKDSPPIVLLHDSLGPVEQWRNFPDELAVRTARDVIAYDRLGYGRSSALLNIPTPFFIRAEAQKIFPSIVDALGLDRYILFGHSVGGAIALSIAAFDTPRCAAVITESAQAFVEERTLTGIRMAKEQFQDNERLEKLVRWHGDKAGWVLDAWTEVWDRPDFADWSLDEELTGVTCPVLAIHGDMDEFGSIAFPHRIVQGVKGPAEVAVLENCGHVPHRERTDEVLSLVSSFLGRHARAI